MKTYLIYFLGLICHVGWDANHKQFAALVADEDHYAAVVTEKHCYPVKPGQFITFGKNDKVFTTSAFRESVLSLENTMGGELKFEIAAPAGTTAAYAMYPKDAAKLENGGGQLGVAKLFLSGGWVHGLGLGDHRGCLARVTALQVETNALKLKVNGQDVVPEDETIVIANVAKNSAEYWQIAEHCQLHKPCAIESDTDMDDDARAAHHLAKFGGMIEGEAPIMVRPLACSAGKIDHLKEPDKWVVKILEAPMPPPESSPNDVGPGECVHILSGVNIGCGNTNWP